MIANSIARTGDLPVVPGDDAIALVAGNVRLATIARSAWRSPRGIERHDLDLLAATAPVGGAAALGQMMAGVGLVEPNWARIAAGDVHRDLVHNHAGLRDEVCPDDLFSVDDAWQLHDRAIAVRCRIEGDSQATLRAYQPDPAVPWLFMADQFLVRPGHAQVARLSLRHAYLPVLLVLVDPEENLLATRLIAFPSLLRGGVHHGEALLAGDGSFAGIDRLAGRLCTTIAGARPGLAEFVVSGVDVDLDGAIGTEPMFSPSIASWLRFMGVALDSRGGDPVLPLRGSGPARRSSDYLLRSPAHSVPSLAIIAARAPLEHDVDDVTGSTIDIAATSREPRLHIGLPRTAVSAEIAAAIPGAPRLVRRSAVVPARFALDAMPMAIRSRNFTAWSGVPDVFGPVEAPASGSTVRLIVVAGPDTNAAATLDNLARAPGAATYHVSIIGGAAPTIDPRCFATVDWNKGESSLMAGIVAAAAAPGDVIVLVCPGIGITDARIVDHLVADALMAGAADVACTALSGPAIDQPEAGHRSSVGHHALTGATDRDAALRWTEIASGRWPVAANSPTVIAISRTAYDRAGGLAQADTIEAALVAFASRARARGLISLCDSRLAVLVRPDAVDAMRSAPNPAAPSTAISTLTRF